MAAIGSTANTSQPVENWTTTSSCRGFNEGYPRSAADCRAAALTSSTLTSTKRLDSGWDLASSPGPSMDRRWQRNLGLTSVVVKARKEWLVECLLPRTN